MIYAYQYESFKPVVQFLRSPENDVASLVIDRIYELANQIELTYLAMHLS